MAGVLTALIRIRIGTIHFVRVRVKSDLSLRDLIKADSIMKVTVTVL